MEKNANIFKLLVPLVAVVIIIESVLLIDGMVRKNKGPSDNATKQEATKQSDFTLTVKSDKAKVKLDETVRVEVLAKANLAKSLDNVNLYLKYEPTKADVSNLTPDAKLPRPTFMKASDKKNVVVVNYYVTDLPAGYKAAKDETLTLIAFDVKPKVAGELNFEISTGNDSNDSATMFVENATGETLTFSSNKLTINVSR